MGARVRIKQQLVRVESVAFFRRKGPVDAKAVKGARANIGDPPVIDFVGEFRQLKALDFARAVAAEYANLDLCRMGRKDREICPLPVPDRAERKRAPSLTRDCLPLNRRLL